MTSMPKEKLSHPCKNTCSGWQAGWDASREHMSKEMLVEQEDGIVKVNGVEVADFSELTKINEALVEEIEELKTKLQEITSAIPKIPAEPHEKALAKKCVELERENERLRGALASVMKENRGEADKYTANRMWHIADQALKEGEIPLLAPVVKVSREELKKLYEPEDQALQREGGE